MQEVKRFFIKTELKNSLMDKIIELKSSLDKKQQILLSNERINNYINLHLLLSKKISSKDLKEAFDALYTRVHK